MPIEPDALKRRISQCLRCGASVISGLRGAVRRHCDDCRKAASTERARSLRGQDPAVPASARSRQCLGCGRPVNAGRAGAVRRHCGSCRKQVRAEKARIRRGRDNPLCIDCGSAVEPGLKTRRCHDCVIARRRLADLDGYYRRSGRVRPPGRGTTAQCADCDRDIIKTKADHILCNDCSTLRMLTIGREGRRRRRRENGIPMKGPGAACERCTQPFVRNSANGKYCPDCRNWPRQRWVKRKRQNDAKYALNQNISASIRKSLAHGSKSRRGWQGLVGYTLADLMLHLERQFLRGMTWSNRDQWHIDHIIPLSKFNFSSADDPEFQLAWSITNLRPLWKLENLLKGSQRTLLL